MKTATTKRKAIADAVELLKEESPNAPGNIAGVQLILLEKVRAFKDHPFRLYEGERLDDMVQSIRDHGILNPVIVRKVYGGYEMLAGHNRLNAAQIAGMTEVPAIVKTDLSDEEAYVYVIETNVIQRSFTDLAPSEKAAVLSARYEKVISQGKRNDILREIEEIGTCGHDVHKSKSRDGIGEEYGMTGRNIARYMRVKPIDFACLDGSLDKISKNAVSNLFNIDFLNMGMKRLRELSNLAKVLSAKYDVMITNPPYRPISSMEAAVSTYAANNYPNSKADLFAMFMETGFAKKNGFVAMINMHGWMSLSTYERLREDVLRSKSIVVMAHLGARAFDTISGEVVQTTSFVLRNNNFKGFTGTFIDLVDGKSETEKQNDFNDKSKLYRTKQDNFSQIPGIPFTAYWVSEDVVKCFEFPVLETVFTTREGMATAGNDVFLRYWHEVSKGRITFGCKDNMQAKTLGVKWVPYNKGGSARDWYGNNEYVVDWSNDGYAIKHNKDPKTGRIRSHNYNGEYGFKEGLTWSAISSGSLSVRYCENGFLFDSKGAKGFCKSNEKLLSILGLLNSKVAMRFLRFLSPTLDFKVGDIICIPYGLEKKHEEEISGIVKDSINLAKEDWDSFETSWDFAGHPLLPQNGTFALSSLHEQWKIICDEKYEKLRANKERINRILIDLYGLQNELDPEIQDKDIMVRSADRETDIKSLISYLIGVAMGRYSLDVEGVIYAGGDWDASKYVTYQSDDDGIIPIYNGIGMEDGLTTVLIKLIKQIYGEDAYRQNIDFIAEALGKNNNESSEETLNRYLNDGFYADHLKIYQKRPIYWLFTSGKKAGFKCLIYMHRYNEDTLARINGKYFLPESTRKKNELEELNGRIAHAEGRDKLKLEKERQNLAAAYNEAIEYGQVLDHMANRYISIDLDDGVKINYAKFQGIEIVTDSGTKVKKDLLSPLK